MIMLILLVVYRCSATSLRNAVVGQLLNVKKHVNATKNYTVGYTFMYTILVGQLLNILS